MQYTVKFNFMNILSFSMKVEAKSHEEALRIIKGSITDGRIFTFPKNQNVILDNLELTNVEDYFSVDPVFSTRYCYFFNEEDDEPTKPDNPIAIRESIRVKK